MCYTWYRVLILVPRVHVVYFSSLSQLVIYREGLAVEALHKRLSQAEAENGPAKECQDFHELTVCASELANWQCEVPDLLKCQ